MDLDLKDLPRPNMFPQQMKELFPLPPYAQTALNLVSMGNFWPLIKPVADVMKPKNICEIGCNWGETTNLLADYSAAMNATLNVIDPAIDIQDPPVKADNIRYFSQLSLEYLADADIADLYFIDGDHNHYTVYNELKMIDERRQPDKPTCLLMHDVGWPCGRRDMYYDPSNLPDTLAHDSPARLSPFSSGLAEFGLNYQIPVAVAEGGAENGVMTAIDDFLKDRPNWRFFWLPSIYGLGVLWPDDSVTAEQRAVLEETRRLFAVLTPYVATLELNRVLLMAKIHDDGWRWKDQQATIGTLTKENESLQADAKVAAMEWQESQDALASQKAIIDGLAGDMDALTEKHRGLWSDHTALQERCNDLQRRWDTITGVRFLRVARRLLGRAST